MGRDAAARMVALGLAPGGVSVEVLSVTAAFIKRKRGRPKGLLGLMVFVSGDTEAWLRREAKRTGVPASNIMELALLRLRHTRPEAGLVELREMTVPRASGAAIEKEAVTVRDLAVRAALGK